MKIFNLSATVTISIFTSVEAETLTEAIKIAQERQIESAKNWNSKKQAMEVWVSDSFDGEPQNIHEE